MTTPVEFLNANASTPRGSEGELKVLDLISRAATDLRPPKAAPKLILLNRVGEAHNIEELLEGIAGLGLRDEGSVGNLFSNEKDVYESLIACVLPSEVRKRPS
jgi:hypothetical protein